MFISQNKLKGTFITERNCVYESRCPEQRISTCPFLIPTSSYKEYPHVVSTFNDISSVCVCFVSPKISKHYLSCYNHSVIIKVILVLHQLPQHLRTIAKVEHTNSKNTDTIGLPIHRDNYNYKGRFVM